jgi:GT2 family glycosyltransferase
MRVGVVVLHFGDPTDTLSCVRSVTASRQPAEPLVVIDNGTGTLEEADLRAAAPGVTFVVVPENLGFAGGANFGIRRALDAGADAVLLLNNDARVEADCLGELARVAASDARIGAVGAKVLSAARGDTLWAAWGVLTWRAALVEMVGRGMGDGPRFSERRDVDAVPGCVMLLTGAALADVGLLDEEFFAYHEDLDWCVRARRRGWRIVFAPAARAHHRGEGSFAQAGPATPARYLSARNTVVFARKHARLLESAGLALRIAMSLPVKWLTGDRAATALLARGYLDGLLRRPIPYRELGLRGSAGDR